jgi:hypothetical protein
MPQDVELVIPFPSRISWDINRARARNVDWLLSCGLLRSSSAVSRYLSWQLAELGARAYPHATGDDLDLVVDHMAWFFLFDDQFDGPLGLQPDRATALCRDLVAITGSPVARRPDTGHPLLDAWADLCNRRAQGMSAAWQHRAAANWERYIDAYVDETVNRARGLALDLQAALALRRRTIGMHPSLDLAERVGRYEIPPAAYTAKLVRDLQECTLDVVILVNEVCSVEKEQARQDVHNLVLIVEQSNRCDRPEAIEVLMAMAGLRISRFVRLEREIPALCEALALPAQSSSVLERYADAMRAWMRGNYDWERRSGRYAAENLIQPHEPGYLEDLLLNYSGSAPSSARG